MGEIVIVLNIEQGTKEWFAARCGVPSASNFSNIITTAGAASKSAEKYMLQLAGEKVSGIKMEGYKSAAMEEGNKREQESRDAYEIMTGMKVEQVGFCYLDERRDRGCSPDGLVGEDGLLELKNPEVQTHVKYLLNQSLPVEYFTQVQGQLYITGRKWCDFMSYFPNMRPLLIRVERNEPFINRLDAAITNFNVGLNDIISRIK